MAERTYTVEPVAAGLVVAECARCRWRASGTEPAVVAAMDDHATQHPTRQEPRRG